MSISNKVTQALMKAVQNNCSRGIDNVNWSLGSNGFSIVGSAKPQM